MLDQDSGNLVWLLNLIREIHFFLFDCLFVLLKSAVLQDILNMYGPFVYKFVQSMHFKCYD